MKVLVATEETQGDVPGDFCYVPEGELIHFGGGACDDKDCACWRAVFGIASRRGTTTFKVVDASEMDEDTYRDLILQAARDGDFLGDGEDETDWLEDIQELQNKATENPVGTVLRCPSPV